MKNVLIYFSKPFKVFNKKHSSYTEEELVPRKRKRSNKITNYYRTSSTAHHATTPKEVYRPMYFKALDMAINTITGRFDQADFKVRISLEQML